jgi:flagellar motor switch protein FliM
MEKIVRNQQLRSDEEEPDAGAPTDLGEALTPEQIDQLIAQVSQPDAEGPTPLASSGVHQFDFRRPNKFSREHVRALSIVHETFARQIGTVLSTTLRAVSQVTVASVDQVSYDDYIAASPNPSLLSILSLEPLSGAGILQLPLPLAMSILDRLLGGSGTGPYPDRPLTDIEEGLVTEVLDRCLVELASAFESLVSLEPKIVQLESNPQFAQVAAPSDMVVVVVFDTRIGGQEGQLSLCIPFTSLQPRLEAVSGHSLAGDRRFEDVAGAAAAMDGALQQVPVDVSVRFAPVTLTSSEVVGLQVGDVLPLGHPADRPLALLAGGIPLLPAVAGRKRKRLACRIVDSDLEGTP